MPSLSDQVAEAKRRGLALRLKLEGEHVTAAAVEAHAERKAVEALPSATPVPDPMAALMKLAEGKA